MFELKPKLALFAVPVALAAGGLTYASVVAFASPTPSATHTAQPQASEPAESSAERSEGAADKAEPNEPAQPGDGHADTDKDADTQQSGTH